MKTVTAGPSFLSPLNGLIWAFGIIGGAVVVLILVSIAVAQAHKARLNFRGSRLSDYSEDFQKDYIQMFGRVFTSGDLVVNREIRDATRLVAEEWRIRKARRNRPDDNPENRPTPPVLPY